jgi:FkbM family methyltransferase
MKHWLKNIDHDDGLTIFDVGANVGGWSSHFLRLNSSLKLHLFEPSQATHSILKRKMANYDICINQFGLSDECCQSELFVANTSSTLNSMYKRINVHGLEMDSSELVEMRTIDSYCDANSIARIDYLKVDVEGHELAVFKGAKNMLSKSAIDFIQFEYGGCNLDSRVFLCDIWTLLQSYGYTVGKLFPDGVHFYDSYDQTLETFAYANFVAKLGIK